MQDICHVLKKLVNCIHYLGTRFIIMADTEAVVDTTYTLNWGMILQLAADDETFRDSVSTTTLQHSDRQNPACATELMATWSLVTKAGFLSLGAYFQAGFLLLSVFYDRTLTVFERAENAWVAFTFSGGGIRYQVPDITLVGGSFFLPKTQLVHGTNWWVYCPFSRKTVSTWY